MEDDLAWGFCDEIDGHLWEGLSHGKGGLVATDITYLPLGPEVEKAPNILEKFLFCLIWHAKRSWVKGIAIVLRYGLREKVQVPVSDCLIPFVDEFDLGGIRAF